MQAAKIPYPPSAIVLDVYHTLLNMSEVEQKINAILDSRRGYAVWFELFMEYCFVDNCTTRFNEFPEIAKATMSMAGKMFGKKFDDKDAEDILHRLRHLPVNDQVQEGLSALKDKGFVVAALTNSSKEVVTDRMERTGLISYFDMVLSAESVRKYKPCKEVYEWAAGQLNTNAEKVLMVTVHGWDIAGAANAGMQTAYLKQNNQVLYPLAPLPDYTCKNLHDLAMQFNPV